MPADRGQPLGEVLAVLVDSVRRELAAAQTELAAARERIAELKARLAPVAAEFLEAAIQRGPGQASAEAVAAAEDRPQAGRAGWA